MNRDQSYALVRQTFTQSFDKNRFLNFVKNVLNRLDESKAASLGNVKNAFKEHVQRYEQLGTYGSPDGGELAVLVVYLQDGSKLERARTALRNFVADHLKARGERDAALVAFVSPSGAQWRFSYVKMEYATVSAESGRVGVEARLTPARRFSYIVGEGESCHTAQTRFLDLLQDTDTNPSLAQIETAFSVEAVTKEFFVKYADIFGEFDTSLTKMLAKDKMLRNAFTAKSVNPVDFAKKLLGQVVFLYFLQKKGWLGVAKHGEWGEGPHDFLRRLARGEYGPYDNFFNDVLEPLFYDTLATDRGHLAWCSRFQCRIPFLNGGLFEPLGDYEWRSTEVLLPNRLFTNNDRVEEGVVGSGLLDVFDRYNFTVNEAEPLEQEVAIDPEMLGQVFENLIEENRRKGLGAYYTPREIVHYMCQESLINYLDIAINSAPAPPTNPQSQLFDEGVRIQAPLLNDDEFKASVPRADIETFVRLGEQISHYEAVDAKYQIRMPASIEPHARLLDRKLAEIAVCDPAVGSGAFPVGMMAEIVRARSSLTPYFNDPRERSPYSFKRHAIQNSLYGVDIDPGAIEIARLRLWLSLVVDEEETTQIKPLPNLDFKLVVGDSLLGFPFRSERLADIEGLKAEFFEETDHVRKSQLKQEVDQKLQECFVGSKQSLGHSVTFDFRIHFSEVFHSKGGFDVVIANPPYVRMELIKPMKPILRASYPEVHAERADLYCYFYARALQVLRPGGTLTFISSNKFFRSGYGAPLRATLAQHTSLSVIIDFNDLPIFAATTYPCVVITCNRSPSATHQIKTLNVRHVIDLGRFEELLFTLLPQHDFAWRLESVHTLRLLDKMRRAGQPLGDYVDGRIYRGIVSGLNEAFVIDRRTREQILAESPGAATIMRPFIGGKAVRKWACSYDEHWLLYLTHGVSTKGLGGVLDHLRPFRRRLEARATEQRWYELQQPQEKFAAAYEAPKILFPDIANELRFAIDSRGAFFSNAAYCIAGADLYLLAVLNSRAVQYFYVLLSAQIRGGYVRMWTQYVEQIPIPDASTSQREALSRLVRAITQEKRRDVLADTSAMEAEIDTVVFSLYGFTADEIRIVTEATLAKPGTGQAMGRREKAIARRKS